MKINMASKVKPTTVSEYIAAAPKESREKLIEIRKCISDAAPDAKESLKWGSLAFSYKRILVTCAAFKHHIGFYPTPNVINAFEKELIKDGFKFAKGSVQFPIDKPLPLELIRKMTQLRVKESNEKDARWM
jgi:uncharacterized protein YdhG (YjbR/CyaY superfamily)